MAIKYSIIIPTFNRAKILQKCLHHISELENPIESWEVLVINNNSNDETEDIIKLFLGKIPQLRYYYTRKPGLHFARNLACEKARGDILCFIDDDSFVSKGWLKGIEKGFLNSEVVLVGGPCLPKFEKQPPNWLKYFWNKAEYGNYLGYLSLVDFRIPTQNISANYVYGCNFNIKKDTLLKLGGFHPDGMPPKLIHFRGDGESFISRRIMDLGAPVIYSPDVIVHHFVLASRLTINYFCKRAYNQGISESFTKIREEYGLYDELPKKKSNIRKTISIIHKSLDKIQRFFLGKEPIRIIKIKNHIKECYRKGYSFHQLEVKKDPKLLEWVLRENYLGKNGELLE
ncbi:MAG: glycosyltransferase family 2 protein [Candidatus Helarchaeota archaeon]